MSADEGKESEDIESVAWKCGFRRMTTVMASNQFKNLQTQPIACLVGATAKHFQKAIECNETLEYNATISFSGALYGFKNGAYVPDDNWLLGDLKLVNTNFKVTSWILDGSVKVDGTLVGVLEFTSTEIDVIEPDGILEVSPDPTMFAFEGIWIRDSDAPRQYPRRKRKPKKFNDE